MMTVGQTPNGLAMWKVLSCGEVFWVLFELKSLMSAFKLALGVDSIALHDLYTAANGLDMAGITDLQSKSAKIFALNQVPNTCLFVPTGYICAEASTKGVLIYGVRKSSLRRSVEAALNYEELVGCHVAAKKNVLNMQGAHEAMK
jgi:hypothetical protein